MVLLRVILTVILLTVFAALIWLRPGRLGSGFRDDRFPSGVRPSPDSWPDNPEGMLARQLADGEITRSHYLLAMSHLAERDATWRPLRVPGD